MANELTEGERLAKFETRLETIETVMLRMETKMDTWQANFVSKELLDEKLKARDERIGRLEQEKTSYKNNLPFWVTAVLAGISILIAIWPHVK